MIMKHQENLDRVYAHCNPVSKVLESNQWSGSRCFIIAGGTSLIDFDFNKLKSEKVIGINKAFIAYPNADINYFMDVTFYESIRSGQQDEIEGIKVKELWDFLKGIKVSLSPHSVYNFNKDIYHVRRKYRFEIPGSINEGIYGGACSAFGALGLAIILGANPIYFLGLDLQIKNRTHFHKGYNKQKVEILKEKLNTYKKQFELYAPQFREVVKIVNLGTEETTSLRCFDIVKAEKVLK